MSWFSALPAGASTRNGSLEAREQRRAEIEAERLLKKQKSEQRKKLLSLGVSAPSSPSLSRANTPPPSGPDRLTETAPTTPVGMNNENANNNGGGGNPQQPPPGGAGGPPPPPPPGGPGGPGGPGDGGRGGAPNHDNQAGEVDYDLQDTADSARAVESSGRVILQINLEDITFWFSELESEMLLAGVGSQWLKLSVLRKNLPVKQREDVKSLLRLKKSEAGRTPYYDVKMTLINLYELKPKDTFKKALGRVLTGLPSQLGKQIVDDICDRHPKLQGCCCAKAAHALWTNQLPTNINQHISNMDFNAATYLNVFTAADRVFLSSRNVTSVAALTSQPNPGYSLTANADSPLNTGFSETPQVAAVTQKKKPKNKKNKNNQNQNSNSQGEQSNNQKGRKGPRHSSNPPHTCCDAHFVHGAGAWFCQAPDRCPWKDKITQKP